MSLRSGGPNDAQWPPRSPHEALLGTPSGRERLRRMADRASPTPSPIRRPKSVNALTSRSANRYDRDISDDEMGVDDDDDEETLQLKLQAIEAKLRLKKLKSAKSKQLTNGGDDGEIFSRPESAPIPDVLAASKSQARDTALRPDPRLRAHSQASEAIQVPASPVRRAQTAQSQTSPRRVQLGIDKGLKAKDVSLKRAPSLRKTSDNQDTQNGGYLRRARTPGVNQGRVSSASEERPKSFSERLAAARTEEIDRKDRLERISQVRSTAFTVDKQEMEQYKSNAIELPDLPYEPEEFSRDEVRAGGQLRRSNTAPSSRRTAKSSDQGSSTLDSQNSDLIEPTKPPRAKKVPPAEVPESETSAFEPYSGTHLSKRILPHSVLTRALVEKKSFLIPDLLKHVKAPSFTLPEIEQDIVVLGILAEKSEPRTHKPSGNISGNSKEVRGLGDGDSESSQRQSKYMVLTICDLKWSLELFLFNSGFERYWKLTPGTLVAILNPTVMPPPPGREATGRFSLVVNSDDDSILELGQARDLGFCKAVKKDGQTCSTWINRKRTEFCEFHMNGVLAKKRLARQDVNAFNTGLGPGYQHNSRRLYGHERSDRQNQKDWKRGNYDAETHKHYFMDRKATSAATLLDRDYIQPGQVADRVEKSEALRRRLATEEKERDIMKQLGKVGKGAGKEYMKLGADIASSAKLGSSITSTGDKADDPKQAGAIAIGLVGSRGKDTRIHLSPVKRKRSESGTSSGGGTLTSGSRSGFGWGGSLKDKLARMKEGENLRNGSAEGAPSSGGNDGAAGQPPQRKKTRFVTEKGIREAGRESLGVELGAASRTKARMVTLDMDDDDDDLLIV